jgi:hypothetical protein
MWTGLTAAQDSTHLRNKINNTCKCVRGVGGLIGYTGAVRKYKAEYFEFCNIPVL